jgi:hypothetical protein
MQSALQSAVTYVVRIETCVRALNVTLEMGKVIRSLNRICFVFVFVVTMTSFGMYLLSDLAVRCTQPHTSWREFAFAKRIVCAHDWDCLNPLKPSGYYMYNHV